MDGQLAGGELGWAIFAGRAQRLNWLGSVVSLRVGVRKKMWVVLSVVEGVAVNSDRRELFKVTPDA